jgi:hypothetical protein
MRRSCSTRSRGYDPLDEFSVRAPRDDFTGRHRRSIEGLRLGIVEDFSFRNVDPSGRGGAARHRRPRRKRARASRT